MHTLLMKIKINDLSFHHRKLEIAEQLKPKGRVKQIMKIAEEINEMGKIYLLF